MYILFPAQHVVDDIAIEVLLQQLVGLLDEQVASFYALRVCKTYELFYKPLPLQVFQQLFLIFILIQLVAVAVSVLEAELYDESSVADFYQV